MGFGDATQWHLNILWFTNLETLCTHLFRFLMEASLHRLDWLKSLVIGSNCSPSALPRDQRMRLKFPSLYSYLVPLATSHPNPIFRGFLFFFKCLMWTIFKVFVEFVTITLLSYDFWFFSFGHKSCGLLAPPQPGIEPAPPALEGEVVITGPPGKSPRGF